MAKNRQKKMNKSNRNKKILAAGLVIILSLSLAGCAETETPRSSGNTIEPFVAPEEIQEDANLADVYAAEIRKTNAAIMKQQPYTNASYAPDHRLPRAEGLDVESSPVPGTRPTATPPKYSSPSPTASKSPTPKPTATVKPTATPKATVKPVATAKPTKTPKPTATPAHTKHTQSGWIIDTEPTCQKEGKQHKECKECHKVLLERSVAKVDHSFIKDSSNPEKHTCKMCNSSEEHVYREKSNTEPTFGQMGQIIEECPLCKIERITEIPMEAGFYDANGILVAKWIFRGGKDYIVPADESGGYGICEINAEYDNTLTGSNTLDAKEYTPYKVLAKYPTAKKVLVRSGVRKIGDYAFMGAGMLDDIIIPETVTAIGTGAFSGSGLTNAEIPNSVTSIAAGVFKDNASLKTAVLPNGLTSVPDELFASCVKMETVTIPTGVTVIGENAFSGCTGLTNIKIPNGATNIKAGAFASCQSLASIIIPDSVTSMGNAAFSGCTSLETLTISSKLTSISAEAFKGCSKLKSVTIPSGVTAIGEKAFKDCTAMTSVTIQGAVTSIGDESFSGCTGISSMTVPDTAETIGANAFKNVGNIIYGGTATGSPWGAIKLQLINRW